MAQGKQAKVLSERQIQKALRHVALTRYPERDRVMFMLSVKAGLRAKEIADLTWTMVQDAEGNVADAIALPDKASKGHNGGRTIPLNKDLREALVAYQPVGANKPGGYIVTTERASKATAGVIVQWFKRLYQSLGFEGCSSHSGRRTFITRAAKKVTEAGGSLRDVQYLAGHASLADTQRYIESDNEARRKLVDLI